MTIRDTRLPKGFESLEPFVGYWVHDSTDDRRDARSKAQMEDIQAFYDQVVARAPEAITYLERFALDAMPEDAARLFKLLLAMNHAAIAVEMHGAPRAFDSPWPAPVRVAKGPWPHGGRIEGAEIGGGFQ
ncbi:MAG: hypothetical protein ACREUE_02535 [Panacagrimonas sp.]